MTKRNLLVPLAAALAALPALIAVAAWQFPLRAAPQEAVDDSGVEVQSGGVKILHRTGISFPEEARSRHLSGTVVVNVSVDDKGEVTGVQAVSGPDELRKPVVQSVSNWHFALDSATAPHSFELAVRFDGGRASQAVFRAESSLVPPGAEDAPRTVTVINLSALPAALRDRVAQAGVVHLGDVLTRDKFNTIEASLRNIDDHLRVTGALDGDKVRLMVHLDTRGTVANRGVIRATISPAATAYSSALTAEPPKSIRVGGNIQASKVINKVTPIYPPDAKQARIQGTVRFEVLIGADGFVKNIQVVSGHPLLVPPALDAVRQWVYSPTLLNGNPVDVITIVDINFTLRDDTTPPQQ